MKGIGDAKTVQNTTIYETLVNHKYFQSYCEKHSMTNRKDSSDTEGEGGSNSKKKSDMTSEQKNQARAAKLRQIEAEFYKHVDVLQTSTVLDIDPETIETIFYYWKLKRRVSSCNCLFFA